MISLEALPIFRSKSLAYDLYPDRFESVIEDDRILEAVNSFALSNQEFNVHFNPSEQLYGGTMSQVYRLGSICLKYSSKFTPRHKHLKPEDLLLQFRFMDHLKNIVNPDELTVPSQIAAFKNQQGEYLKIEDYVPDHINLFKFRHRLNPDDKLALLHETARRVTRLREVSPFLAIGLNDLIDDDAQNPNPSNILIPDTPDLDYFNHPFVVIDQPSSELNLNRLRALRSYLKLNHKR